MELKEPTMPTRCEVCGRPLNPKHENDYNVTFSGIVACNICFETPETMRKAERLQESIINAKWTGAGNDLF